MAPTISAFHWLKNPKWRISHEPAHLFALRVVKCYNLIGLNSPVRGKTFLEEGSSADHAFQAGRTSDGITHYKMAEKQGKKQQGYTAESIQVLEGLDPVRKRPGMYIGSTDSRGLHHLVWEVVDNSVDEALAGYCNQVIIIVKKDGSVCVIDNGRGIPVAIHPKHNKSAMEMALTMLHAGGKFEKDSYKVSGGLHGVGVSVVNALSKHLKAEVKRDGKLWVQEYQRGIPLGPVKPVGDAQGTGTTITFSPDPEIFETLQFDDDILIGRIRELAFLNKGVEFFFNDERADRKEIFKFEGGIKQFVEYLNRNKT